MLIRRAGSVVVGLVVSVVIASAAFAQGVYVSSAGPVNRGMGGASAAAPIDAIGALYWNPATISGLPNSEMAFGLDLILADHEVASSAGPVSGVTQGDAGVFPVPTVGWVYHVEGSPSVTLGLGVGGVAGFKTNLPADPTNPVLAPAPTGLGRIASEAAFLQLAPVISVALTDNLSVAAGPIVTLGQVEIEPFVFASPNANGRYSPGRATRYHWGGGAQAGVYYIHNCVWHFGASLKTPAWMEDFEFYGEDEAGNPRSLTTDLDLPLIASAGLAYSGLPNWVFAADVRWFDYQNTEGFGGTASFDATGALEGLGWRSVFAAAAGVQRRVSDRLYVRAGYTYNQNPIENDKSFFNMGSVLIYEHMVSAGFSWNFNDWTALSFAWSYMLENERTGPIYQPGVGPLDGTSVTNDLDVHLISVGLSMRR